MMCQDQVLDLPENAVLLATTTDCPHGMFRVGERMLGIQAHPEFPKSYDQALMELRVERMGEAKVKSGIESLKKDVDALILAAWIHNFVSQVG
jgi:GMP synthase-like glutamine amidotransferase